MLEIFINEKKYNSFINYAIDTCDSLSIVLTKDEIDKCLYTLQELYYKLSDFIIQKRNIGHHPDTNTEFENCDYIKIRCSKELKPILLRAGNFDCWNGEVFPEELCFYRGDKKWFSYISHEKQAVVWNETKEDIHYFDKEEIS